MPHQESPKKSNFVENIHSSIKTEMKKGVFGRKLQRWMRDTFAFIIDLKRIQNITKNNYELGKKHYDLGNFEDAVMRFKFVTWLDSKQVMAWFWLGKSYMASGNVQKAVVAFGKSLELKPELQEARDLLKSINEAKINGSP